MKKQISSKKKIILITVSLILVALLAWFGVFLYKYFTDHGERKTYVDPFTGRVFHYYLDEYDRPYIYDPRSLGKKTLFPIPEKVSPKEAAKLKAECEKAMAEKAAAEKSTAAKK